VHMPANLLAAAAGIWLFYVQHQYEEGYWPKDEEWDYSLAGIKGSSYYKLPKLLQYWSGNIGFHHIHHLAPKIPNYKLEQCHKENPWFHQAVTLTLWESFGTLRLKLFDEETQRMVSFGEANLERAPAPQVTEAPQSMNVAA
jgi:acyl-lipid omega-6 desaturase (Delta-12 desaturase)